MKVTPLNEMEGNLLMCMFCCKNVKETCPNLGSLENDQEELVNNNKSEILSRFFVLTDRQFKSKSAPNPTELLSTCSTATCLDCFGVIDSFCKLYNQVKELELRLNWQIDKLFNIMKLADRVPSRVKAYREWCSVNSVKTEIIFSTDERREEDKARRLIQFRQNFKRKCKQYLGTIMPRVHISVHSIHPNKEIGPAQAQHTENLDPSTVSSDNNGQLIDSEISNMSRDEKIKIYLLGWVTSFTSIIFLYHLPNTPSHACCKSTKEICWSPLSSPPPVSTLKSVSTPHEEVSLGDGTERLSAVGRTHSPHQEPSDDNMIEMEGYYNASVSSFKQESEEANEGSNQDTEDEHITYVTVPNLSTESVVSSNPSSPPINVKRKRGTCASDTNTNEGLNAAEGKLVLHKITTAHDHHHGCCDTGVADVEHSALKPPYFSTIHHAVPTLPLLHNNKPLPPPPPSIETQHVGVPTEPIRSRRKVFKCSICKATFTNSDLLESHIFSKHSEGSYNNEDEEVDIRDSERGEDYSEAGVLSFSTAPEICWSPPPSSTASEICWSPPPSSPAPVTTVESLFPVSTPLEEITLEKGPEIATFYSKERSHCEQQTSFDFTNIPKPPPPPPSEMKAVAAIPIRRSLRKVFKCSICNATFTNSDRLEAHTSANHKGVPNSDDEEDDIRDSERDEAGVQNINVSRAAVAGFKNKWASGNKRRKMNVSCVDLKLEMESEESSSDSETLSDEEHVIPGRVSTKRGPRRTKPQKIECPKCKPEVAVIHSAKFMTLQSRVEQHDRYFHSNGQHFSSKSIHFTKIEELLLEHFPPPDSRHHPCKVNDCSKAFALSEELQRHAKLEHDNCKEHTCHFCDVAINSVVALIDHEREHSDEKEMLKNKDYKAGDRYICGRCDYVTHRRPDFLNHYLELHLEMSPIEATCPICSQKFPGIAAVPLFHYINFHDLRRLDDPLKPFRCLNDGCGAYFLKEDQLHAHWNRSHKHHDLENHKVKSKNKKTWKQKQKTTPQVYPCPQCTALLTSKSRLRDHIWGRHTSKQRGIKLHGETVISTPEEGITINDLVHDTKTTHVCGVEQCKKGFWNQEDLNTHSKLHGEFKCDFCDVVKSFAPDLALHETLHAVGEKQELGKQTNPNHNFFCVRCLFSSRIGADYIKHHLDKHLGLTMDQKRCPICKHAYTFDSLCTNPNLPQLRQNIIAHFVDWHDINNDNTGDQSSSSKSTNSYKCTYESCSAFFTTANYLQRHISEIHEKATTQSKDRFKCQDCGKGFATSTHLRKHRVKVHKMKVEDFQFGCDICSKRFEKNWELEKHHTFVHQTDKVELKCPQENCGKKFWSEKYLQVHIRMAHSKKHHPKIERNPKVCEQCGKKFSSSYRLTIHLQRHAGTLAWKFSCEVCNKKIFSRTKLAEHMRTHTKEKPFVCQVCGVAYAHGHNLRIHLKNKHGLQEQKAM